MTEERVLFAMCGKRYPVLAWEGEHVEFEFNEVSFDLGDVHGEHGLPKEPGLYVWTGNVIMTQRSVNYNGGEEYDFDWEGTWRQASLSDLQTFKIPIAPITRKDIE